MEHRTRIERTFVVLLRISIVVAFAAAVLMIAPAKSRAITMLAPADGATLDWIQTRPVVAFDVPTGEKPKWALLATDAAMTQTIRYCRVFGAAWVNGGWHWGCDAWSIGVDSWGQDIVRPVDPEKTYYLQVVYTDKDNAEQKTTVRSFSIAALPEMGDISDISDKIWGSVYGDGSGLNTGAAAFANSGLKVNNIKSARQSRFRFTIALGYSGNADLAKSYVKVTSKAGTRYLPMTAGASGGAASATWLLSRDERALKRREFKYQAFLKSTKNGAMVKSVMRVLVIKRR